MTARGDHASDLGEYLFARRAAVPPEEVGLPRGRRRVPGLRREEVAALAGVSVDYYTRLEQGRERSPSRQMLNALAAALRLNSNEYSHLCLVAGNPVAEGGRTTSRQVHPTLRQLLDQWERTPAYVVDDTQEILAENALGAALHSGFTHRDNFSRMIFLDPEGPRFFRDWNRIAAANVGSLRQAWGRPGARSRLEPVIAELTAASPHFEGLWCGHTVAAKTREAKRLAHADVGELTLTYHAFVLTEVGGQHVAVCQAEPGSRSEEALRLLSILASGTVAPRSE